MRILVKMNLLEEISFIVDTFKIEGEHNEQQRPMLLNITVNQKDIEHLDSTHISSIFEELKIGEEFLLELDVVEINNREIEDCNIFIGMVKPIEKTINCVSGEFNMEVILKANN